MRKHTPLCVELLEIRNLMSCVMPPLPTAAVQQMIGEQNAVMALVPLTSVTDEAIGGNWSDPTSWKSGVLPGAGANIEIDSGITEVYDLASSPAYNSIRIDGTLTVANAASTSLLVQTIVDMPTGTFNDVQPNAAITSTITFADTGPLDLVNDPKELGRGYLAVGLMNADGTMGAAATTNIVGAQKDGWESIGGIDAGTTSLSFESSPVGWQTGDKILFSGTGNGSQDETVTINAIQGNTISFAPLLYPHQTPTTHASAAPQPPFAPTGLTGSTTDGQVVLTWDANGATSYNLYRSTTSGAETLYQSGLTSPTFTDTGLADGTTYFYWVTAVNSLGEGGPTGELQATPVAKIIPPAPPLAPANLTGTATDSQVVLTWDASAGATSYNLYRSTTSGGETLYQSKLTATTFTDSGLTDGQSYFYWVTAVSSNGEGGRTGELQAMPQAGGGPPIAYHINFTGDPKEIPAGYIDDGGLTFRAQNGATYGWVTDNTSNMRDREASNAPDEVHDSLGHMQRNVNLPVSQWTGVGDQWSIAVPNGTYTVHILGGDPSYTDSTYAITANGQVVVSGTPTSGHLWLEGTAQVTVTNGLITIGNGNGSVNDKIDSIDITGNSGGGSPTVTHAGQYPPVVPPTPINPPVVTHAGPPPAPPAPPPPPSGGVQMQTTVANLTRNIVFQSQVITPVAPTLTGTAVSSSELDFSWTAVDNVTGYQLQKGWTDGGGTTLWSVLGDFTPSQLSFNATGLGSGFNGSFRVVAVHDLNTSPSSNVLFLKTNDYPIVTTGKWPGPANEAAMTPGFISPLRLGHIMFMHTDQDTIDYVEMDNLGRTDKSKDLGATTADSNGEMVTNVLGRYAIHFHRLYNSSPDCLVTVMGDVVTGGPGWGFDNHSSNVNFTDDVDYGTYGAGFVTEAGDETGSFIHDLSVHNTSNQSLTRPNATGLTGKDSNNDWGSEGFGFFLQGKYGIALENNVAAESTMAGFWLNGSGLVQTGGFGTTQFWTQNITDPSLIPAGNPVSVPDNILPMLDFTGNTFEVGNEGLWISGSPSNSRDQISNFTGWGIVNIGVENYYGQHQNFDGITLLGVNASNGLQTTFGYTSSTEQSNMDIEGFDQGLQISGNFSPNVINNAGYFDNKINFYIDVAGGGDPSGQITIQGTDPQFGNRSHVAGGYDYYFVPLNKGDFGPEVDAQDMAVFRYWKAFINTTSHPNEQIYMATQGWNVDPFSIPYDPTDHETGFTAFQLAGYSDADKAMTNGELWQTYGRTAGGYAAPADAVPLAGSNVLVAETQPTLPNWQLVSARELNNPTNYVLKVYDPATKANYVASAPVTLHEGWNFVPLTFEGQSFSEMVFVDTQPPVLTLSPNQITSISISQLSQPFAVLWSWTDNSKAETPNNETTNFKNLLSFPLQTRPDGTQFIVIPIVKSDDVGNSTELDVTINVTM